MYLTLTDGPGLTHRGLCHGQAGLWGHGSCGVGAEDTGRSEGWSRCLPIPPSGRRAGIFCSRPSSRTHFLPRPFGGNQLFLLELALSLRVYVRPPAFHWDCEPCEAARFTHSSVWPFSTGLFMSSLAGRLPDLLTLITIIGEETNQNGESCLMLK